MFRKVLHAILLIPLVALSVYSSYTYMVSMLAEEGSNDVILRFEGHIEKRVGNRTPFSHGVLGYLTDEHAYAVESDQENEDMEYVLSQYALAPLILNKGAYREWTVLNMSAEAYEAWSKAHEGEYEIISAGDGFYLIKRLP